MKKYWLGIVAGCLLVIAAIVVYIKEKQSAALTIIGGADGPTSIFLAGKVGNGSIVIIASILLFVIGAICIFLKKKSE